MIGALGKLVGGTISATLLGCLLGGCSGQSRRSDRPSDDNSQFYWTIGATAPLLFPVESQQTCFLFGEAGEFPIAHTRLGQGIAHRSSIELLDNLEAKLPLPYGFKTTWLSYADRKVYSKEIHFTPEQQARILQLFTDGYFVAFDSRKPDVLTHTTYNTFILSMLPGGRVWLHLLGRGRAVFVDEFRCDQIYLTPRELGLPIEDDIKTMDDFFARRIATEYAHTRLESYSEDDMPYDLWDRYAERFDYQFDVVLQDTIEGRVGLRGIEFTNGEVFRSESLQQIELRARPKAMGVDWVVDDVPYGAKIFFDEAEVIELFDRAFDTSVGKGVLVVQIGQDNKTFDIHLRRGDTLYPIHKARIEVLRYGQQYALIGGAAPGATLGGASVPMRFIGE